MRSLYRIQVFLSSFAVLFATALCLGLVNWPAVRASGGHPLQTDGPVAESAILLAPDPTLGAVFGTSVAMDGNSLLVGAPFARSGSGQEIGAAYVFVRNGTSWAFQAKLDYPGTDIGSEYGGAVSISGDTAVVGARLDEVGGAFPEGSLYVFVRNGTNWTLQQRINVPNTAIGIHLGVSVAIDGNTIVAGASNDVVNGLNTGSAYTFFRSGTTWTQEAKLTDVDGNVPGQGGFGLNVDIHQDTAIVGVRSATMAPGFIPGAVVIFKRIGGVWTREARITSADGLNGDQFGYDVAIEGDVAVIGAPEHAVVQPISAGAVYVFARSGAVWTQSQKLPSTEPGEFGKFGRSIEISGNRMIVGAPLSDPRGNDMQGAAFEFLRTDVSWVIQNQLTASTDLPGVRFGTAVDISGNRVLCGVPRFDVPGTNDAGGVYYFVESPGRPDLRPENDSGISSTDNITNQRDLTFDVNGITPGATVELLRNGVAIESRVVNQTSAVFIDTAVPPNMTYQYATRQIVAGEVSSTSELVIVSIDVIAPTVTINQAVGQPDPHPGPDYIFEVNFSEVVVGYTASDVSLVGSTANISQATIVIAPAPEFITISNVTANGQFIRASVPPAIASDPAGNMNSASTSFDNTITVDTVRPTVTIDQAPTQPDPTTQLPVNFRVVFSEPVVGFEAADVLTSGVFAPVLEITGSGAVYNVAMIQGIADGGAFGTNPVIFRVREQTVRDLAGNSNFDSTSTDNSVTLDNVRPTVSVQREQGQSDPAWSFPVRFRVAFSEPIVGFGPEDVSLAGSTVNTQNASIQITGDGTLRTVALSNLGRGGFVRVTIPGGGLQDTLGNMNLPSTGNENTVVLVYVADPSFELTDFVGDNPVWGSTSTFFGTSLCRVNNCGTGGGTAGPRLGSAWVWFDGTGMTTAEQASASQTIAFPTGGVATLTYYLRIGFVNAPSDSVLVVKVDGTVVQTITEPATAEAGYSLRTIDVSAFADGASHILKFEYSRPGTGPSDNFSLDDVSINTPMAPPRRTAFDYDGDGKSDFGVFRPSTGTWFVLKSQTGTSESFGFGQNGDVPLDADFDGDLKADYAVWRPSTGEWWYRRSSDGTTGGVAWGTNGDKTIAADYDGDGITDFGVWRPSNGINYIVKSTGGFLGVQWGTVGDIPSHTDLDNDGKTDFAVFRPSTGTWYTLINGTTTNEAFQFGQTGDIPVKADFDGDQKGDIAVWRPSTGEWFFRRSSNGTFGGLQWGANGDRPVPGDYDGDGKTDFGVWRSTDGIHYIVRNSGGFIGVVWGGAGDVPVLGSPLP